MSQEEIKPADAKQEEIKTPEAVVENPLTVESIEAQIADLQAKLGEMKRASEKTIQTETGQIDISAEKLDVESPEEISIARQEIGDIEIKKQVIAKEANEKIQSEAMEFFIANSEKDVIAEPKKKETLQEAPVENKEPVQGADRLAEPDIEYKSLIEKIKPINDEINKRVVEIINDRKDKKDPSWHGTDEQNQAIDSLRKEKDLLTIRADEIEEEKDRLISKKESVAKDLSANEKSKADLEKNLGKKFEVRQEAENIMREVKAMRGELDSEKGKLVLNSKITKKLIELMMQPGVLPEAGKKWTELYKPIDEIDFNQVQEIIDQYNKADALDKEIDANETKDREEIESVYGIEPINIDKVLKNNTNPDLKKTREEIKTKLFERVLKNKANKREMIMAEEYAAKAVNATGGTGFRTVPRVWYENKRLLKAMMKANSQIDEAYIKRRLEQK
ncbi:MAG: hypothetical protein A2271_01520 [Candidatus Moranbacteria bacterium RIFOXYA12_FULL_35_19]|nr:MAG: hypothetical protein UR78_C0012G0025 [Candidatus Moranbacteria bacterium GW2011_GWF2_35_39]OGI32915.1 MAG: hypothetical protein A2489_00660 [Candidatus Moranbacteria bacterium RIFOXYC12_FULL_36_13]OGI35965.1 MAG: hypothetical protein A2271_01520 [Candidatus Moranbacteria bacterium RIFOXYA12_FULL_35_19]